MNVVFSTQRLKSCVCVCVTSLSGGRVGGVQDLLRQDPWDGRVPEMGPHVPARVALHLRPRQELQRLRGAHGHGPPGERERGPRSRFSPPVPQSHTQNVEGALAGMRRPRLPCKLRGVSSAAALRRHGRHGSPGGALGSDMSAHSSSVLARSIKTDASAGGVVMFNKLQCKENVEETRKGGSVSLYTERE